MDWAKTESIGRRQASKARQTHCLDRYRGHKQWLSSLWSLQDLRAIPNYSRNPKDLKSSYPPFRLQGQKDRWAKGGYTEPLRKDRWANLSHMHCAYTELQWDIPHYSNPTRDSTVGQTLWGQHQKSYIDQLTEIQNFSSPGNIPSPRA